jgi:RadC-like JAB domain
VREIRTLRLTWRGLETWPRWNCEPIPQSKERNWKPSTYSRRACPRPYRRGTDGKGAQATSPAVYPTKPAILANAAAILCGHNHPSSDPAPSREDRALTQRLVEAGKLLGIPLEDHVVLGDGTTAYFSFADQGLL